MLQFFILSFLSLYTHTPSQLHAYTKLVASHLQSPLIFAILSRYIWKEQNMFMIDQAAATMMGSLFRFSLLIVLLPSWSWTEATTVRSSTLLLARSHSVQSPNAGSPLAAWAASLAADAAHLATLAPKPKGNGRTFVPIAAGRQLLSVPSYVARARLGTPPQALLVAVDPSNDAAWVPCSACVGCSSSAPSFDPTQSATYRPVRCGAPQCAQVPPAAPSCPAGPGASCAFNLSYASSALHAVLGQDALSLEAGNGAAEDRYYYTFGCLRVVVAGSGVSSVPPQGLIGFGRGPLSFLSQTRATYGSVFSYCLPSYKSSSFSGTLRLGPSGQPRRIKTTPLLSNPHRPSLYYVDMVGVRVGGRGVPIPASALALDAATGRGGTVVDAGTMFTRLSPQAYAAVRAAFRRAVRAAPVASPLGGFDTCYYYANGTKAPAVALVFAEGARVTLPEENVVIRSTYGGVACLAMAAAPGDGVNAGLNVLASMQQQNHRVLFDVANGRVGFSRELCTAV